MRFAWMATHRLFVKNQKQFHFDDLEKRRARFGEIIIDFAKSIPRNSITDRIINQSGGIATTGGATMLKRMIRYRKRNFLSALAPARRKRVKRNIFYAWLFAPFLSQMRKLESCGSRPRSCT